MEVLQKLKSKGLSLLILWYQGW